MGRSTRFDMLNLSRAVVVVVLLALAVMSVGTSLRHSSQEAPVTAEVLRVIDGDTVVVRLDGEERTVRYLGVDAPEMDWSTGRHEMYAAEATEANHRLVADSTVELVFDAVQEDQYGRLLAHVFADGVHVNRYLIAQGLAQIYFIEPNLLYFEEFLSDQREAQAAGRGYWGELKEPLPAAEAGNHIGFFRTVEGAVTSAAHDSDSNITFVNLSGGLALRIYPEGRELFAEPPETTLAGRRIQVTGLIAGDASRPYIIVRDPEWINVLE